MLFLLILIISFILQLFLPPWIVGIIAFILASWQARTATQAFTSGFAAIFVLWIVMCLIKSIPNNHLLANRVGQMFLLPDWKGNWVLVLLATGMTGGLMAGISALAGFYCRKVMGR